MRLYEMLEDICRLARVSPSEWIQRELMEDIASSLDALQSSGKFGELIAARLAYVLEKDDES